MKEWGFAQSNPAERLAELHYYSILKSHPRGEVEIVITIREFITPKDPDMLFFAQADKQTNQKTAPFTASGWGRTLLDALSECIKAINRFPYEGPDAG
jgi:hypothetical protein